MSIQEPAGQRTAAEPQAGKAPPLTSATFPLVPDRLSEDEVWWVQFPV